MFRSYSANSSNGGVAAPGPLAAGVIEQRNVRSSSWRAVAAWRSLRISALLAGALLVPQLASAQEPCGDETCPAGTECQVAGTGCAGPCYETPDGEWYCEPAECESETYYSCVPSSCESDADCGSDMLCHIQEREVCATAPPEQLICPPGVDCAPVEPVDDAVPECETYVESRCAYPHELPCETDEHCGAGFECVPTESCWCSGSAPVPMTPDGVPVGGAPSEPPPEPECGCEPTGENHCEAIEVACESDADCLEGWSCLEHGGACWQAPDGSSGCDEGEWRCTPPSFGGPGAPGGVENDVGSGDPSAPPGGAVGEPGMQSSPGGDPGGSAGPGSGDSDDGAAGNPAPRPPRPLLWGHCSAAAVGAGGASLWSLSLAALGFGLIRRRRR